MKKLILTMLMCFIVTTAQAGILTNDGNVDWDTEYYGIHLDIVDYFFAKTLDDGTHYVSVRTWQEGLNVPEMWDWMEIHNRTSKGENPQGVPAEIIDNKIQFNTTWMFQDNIPGCKGAFHSEQNEFGIRGASFPNTRNIETAFQQSDDRPIEFTVPQNIPCTGTSEGYKDFTGESFLWVFVEFPPEQQGAYLDLLSKVNNFIELSSDEIAFDLAFDESGQPIIPEKLFFIQE